MHIDGIRYRIMLNGHIGIDVPESYYTFSPVR